MANRFLSNIRINDAYTFPASDGTSGQVIGTDGAGNLSFINIESEAGSTVIYKDNFSGDNSTVTFELAHAVSDEVVTQVYMDGVYQNKDTYIVSGDQITFDSAPPTGVEIEVISFNTVSTQGIIAYNAKNSTGSTIAAGTAVMAVGTDGNSGHILIAPMVADGSVEPKYFMGVTADEVLNGEYVDVVHFGVIGKINTSSFSDGDVLWLDPANNGGFTTTEPNAPSIKMAAAIVLNSGTNGKIFVRVQGNEGLHELHDVHIENLANQDILVYNTTQGYWENSKTLGDITTGNITTNGTVDGVDVSAFKAAYDVHTHVEGDITDFGNYLTNITHDTVNNKLVVTTRDAATFDVDLTQYIDDSNLARLTSGSLDAGTGIATFTRDDATTFTVDFSALFDDTDTNDFLTGASFDTADGVLTLNVSNQTDVTVDLDGRYLESYTETDTLATVTGRGSTTSSSITISTTSSPGLKISKDRNTDNRFLRLNDTGTSGKDYDLINNGNFAIYNHTDGNYVLQVTSSGNGTFYGNLTSFGTITSSGGDSTQWDTAYGWGDHSTAGYLTSYTETDTLATVTARGNTTSGDINVYGNIILTGDATTTNQGRLIDFTGFDKESTGDFTDRAYIQHTSGTGGHSGSVLFISSQNDANDGIAFDTNPSSQLKHNGHIIWDAGNDGSGSGLDADLLDGMQPGSSTNNIAFLGNTRNLVINDPEAYTGEVRLGAAWDYGGVYASNTMTVASSSDINFVINNAVYANLTTDYFSHNGKILMGTFPQSTYNSGAAWIGRAADRALGTMTVQLGQDTNRTFEVVDHAWTVVTFNVNGSGTATASGSFRAPIFYDSQDTNYYSDPNGLTRAKAINVGTNVLTGSTTYPLGVSNAQKYQIGFQNSSSSEPQYYPWLAHDDWNGSAAILHFNGIGDKFRFSRLGIGQADNDWRAPLFYDSNDTSYYVDPASTSVLNGLTVGGSDVILGSRKSYGSISGSSGDWYPLLNVNDFNGPVFATVTTYAHSSFSIVCSGGYSPSNQPSLQVLSTTWNNNGGYANATGVRIRQDGWVEVKFEWSSGPSVSVRVQAYNSSGTPVTFASSLAATTATNAVKSTFGLTTTGAMQANYMWSNVDQRAPIFYDSDDTARYVNPSSQSNMGKILFLNTVDQGTPVGEALVGRNYAYNTLELKGYGAEMMIGSQSQDLHINYRYCNGVGNNTYTPQNWYWRAGTSGNWSNHSFGYVYGYQFYDVLNTAYYCDPAGLTNIYALECAASADFNSSANFNGDAKFNARASIGTLPDTGVGLKIQGGSNGGLALKLLGGGYASTMAIETPTYGSGISFTHTGSFNVNFASFKYGANAVGYIQVTSTSTVYSTSSDYRLKENIVPMTGALDRVSLLKPSRFNFIGDDKIVDGFIAHEAQEVVPEAVTGEKDGVDYNGDPEYQGIDQSKLVPLLVGAIQELKAEVEALKQQLNGTN